MSERNQSRRNDPRPRVQPSPDNAPPAKDEPTPNAREGEIRHILDTGLPPGIRVDEAKDPGAKPPHGPTDDRS